MNTDSVSFTETIDGREVEMVLVETWDGLYAPIGVVRPEGEGPFPIVLLASGNGGEGLGWLRNAFQNRSYIIDRLVEAGYAAAWLRYRTEVELGYNDGGPLIRDMRQGRELFNRSPLEYEDEIAIIEFVKTLDFVDPDRVGLVGVSHGGEMIMKLTSEYHGATVGVACEPASHEYLWLTPDETAHVKEETGLRDIESMMMTEVEKVRQRIDHDIAMRRISGIQTPILVMGRETDELQGIFRLNYELLAEAGKDVEWVSYDDDLHGYIYPMRGADGEYDLHGAKVEAIAFVIDYLDRHLQPASS
jgi:dienelactone hydrolase